MKLRRFIASAFALALVAAMLFGCAPAANSGSADQENDVAAAEPVTVHVAALKGPTAMGMVEYMEAAGSDGEGGLTEGAVSTEAADSENPYDMSFSIYASADEITPKLVQGEIDIAAVPANLASVLFNNTDGGVQVIAVNTLGVLYICESGDTVHSVADLAGKTIYAAGKGSTPEYALDYILEGNGLTPDVDVTVEWKSEHAECVAALASDPDGIALLPQPFVTTAQMQDPSIRVALDLTEEWDALQNGTDVASTLITGSLVVRSAFAEEHPDAVDAFLSRYAESVEFANDNVEEAAQLIEKFGIVKAAVAEKALPACKIVCITGDEMKGMLSGYLAVLFDANPASVGGELPGDSFYYTGE